MAALRKTLEAHAPPEGLLQHSNRGSTYTAGDYRELLAGNAMECSVSRKADRWDNAVPESFFSTLKKESGGARSVRRAAWRRGRSR